MHKLLYLHLISVNIFLDPTYRSIVLPYCISVALNIQDKLEGLKRAYKDLQIIRNEYVRYNQYMLGQKAAAYLEEKNMVDAARGKLEAEMEELKETKEKLEKSYKRAGELKAEKSLLEREKEAVGTIDLEEADEKLRQCRNRQEDAGNLTYSFRIICRSL